MSFLAPGMLAWAALAALAPVVIYLIFFRRATPTAWGAMELLRRALRRHKQRHRFEDMLLLAIRILIVLLVGLALARPALRAAGGLGEGAYHAIVVIDASAGMGYQEAGQTLFEHGTALARTAVTRLPGAPLISTVVATARPRVLDATPTLDKEHAARQLASLSPTQLGDNPAALLQLLEQHAREVAAPHTTVMLLSDFQRHAWSDAAGALRDAIGGLPSNVQFDLAPLRPQEPENATVRELTLETDALAVGRPITVHAELSWQGAQPLEDIPVELLVNEQAMARRLVTLTPDAPVRIELRHTFNDPGLYELALRLPGDRLPMDDQRGATLRIEASVPLLLIEDAPPSQDAPAAADFLEAALAPRDDGEGLARIAPWTLRRANVAALERESLDDYRVTLVADLARLAERELQQLHAHLDQGGLALAGLGAGATERTLRALELPVQLEGGVGEVGGEPIGTLLPVQERHPIMAPFADGPFRRDLATVQLIAARELSLPPQGRAVPLLAAVVEGEAENLPWLLDIPVGAGRLLLFASALDRQDSDLPLHPSYVALMHGALVDLARAGEAEGRLTVGQPWRQPLTQGDLDGTPLLERPDGARFSAEDLIRGGTTSLELVLEHTDLTGFHRFRGGPRDEVRQGVYVAPPPEESDLDYMNDAELRALFGGRLAQLITDDAGEVLGARHPVEASESWRWFIIAVVVLLVAESILARRFGAGKPLLPLPRKEAA